jgi:hypothetical protein
VPQIRRVYEENFGVFGARKVWQQLRRKAFVVARCTVEHLMYSMELSGVVREHKCRTTIVEVGAERPLDRVNREFRATRPNELWWPTLPTSRPGPASSTLPS